MPEEPPTVIALPSDDNACVRVRPSARTGAPVTVDIVLVPRVSRPERVAEPPAEHVSGACLPTDLVETLPGRGVLAQALSSAGTPLGDARYLVTDTGVRYAVPSDAALSSLGYSTADVRGVPAALLLMLPAGPDLDPAAAANATTDSPEPPACSLGALTAARRAG
ncbi:type VII secretion protein EccB [Streptomyces sp. NPDC035033]|uniref:type VII secretion protein EccB n=1 Tax=Streptomyces sp. NPDC035033 TaxID=3155368 RepID=UPI0033F5A2FD